MPVCIHVVQGNINVKSHNMVEDKPLFRAIHGAINACIIPGCVTLPVACDIRYHFILLYDCRIISLNLQISHNDNDCLFIDGVQPIGLCAPYYNPSLGTISYATRRFLLTLYIGRIDIIDHFHNRISYITQHGDGYDFYHV